MYQPPPINDLSRKAIGIGIVCGLEVLVGADCTITITRGYGITSRGFPLQFPERHFRYYRRYGKGVKGLTNEHADVEVWEILSEKEPGSYPITPQVIGSSRFIDGKVVLLYLENPYEGQVRPLLIDREELWEIINQNNGLDIECLQLEGTEPDDIGLFDYEDEDFPSGQILYCAINRNTSLQPIYCMRFGFATHENECDPEEREFKIESPDCKGLVKEYKLIIVDALTKLQSRITAMHQDIFADLFPQQQRYFLDRYFNFLRGNRRLSFDEPPREFYIQYFYNLIKDLISTYNELLEELCALVADCCPDENLFPCHLLLGEIQEDISFGHSVFRHHFRQPPIYNGNQLRLQKIRFLHWRMAMQIKNFYIPGLESTEMAEGHYTQIEKNDQPPAIIGNMASLDLIRITPNSDHCLPLGEQSIPFYYYVAGDSSSMHHYWNFEAVYCCKKQHIWSYHAEDDDSHTNECAVKRPLAYTSCYRGHYRVEGLIGQCIDPVEGETVFDRLDLLKTRFNLHFRVIPLAFEEFFAATDEPECFQIARPYQGAEHINGITFGGKLIVLYDEDCKIKADFWLPSCCTPPPPETGETGFSSGDTSFVPPETDDEPHLPTGEDTGGLPTGDGETGPPSTGDETGTTPRWEVTVRLIPCDGVPTRTNIIIDGTVITPNHDGSFTFTTEDSPVMIELENPNFYAETTIINLPDTPQTYDFGDIAVYPKKKISVGLILGSTQTDDLSDEIVTLTPISSPTSEIEQSPPVGSDIAVFSGLMDTEFTVSWRDQEEDITMDICDSDLFITLTSEEERILFPPEFEDATWQEWPGKPIPFTAEIVDRYKEIWSIRLERFEKMKNLLEPPIQKAIEPLLQPLIQDFKADRTMLSNSFNALVAISSQKPGNLDDQVWTDFAKDISEMYLERIALLEKDFQEDIYGQLAKLHQFNVIPKELIPAWVDQWKVSVKGITNPQFETGLDPVRIIEIDLGHGGGSAGFTRLDNEDIHGMGPKALDWLVENRIDSLEKLATLSPAELAAIMQQSDSPNLRNRDVSAWPKEARDKLRGT